MITERDLDEAIAECLGKRNPDAQTCMKLAAFYTIKQHMFGKIEPEKAETPDPVSSYSFSAGNSTVSYGSDTGFGKAVSGLENDRVWPLIDEMVETVRVVSPRLYDAFMRKLSDM